MEGCGGVEVFGDQLFGGDLHIVFRINFGHDGHDVEGIQNAVIDQGVGSLKIHIGVQVS